MCRCGHAAFEHQWRPGGRGRCRQIIASRSWLDFDLCPCQALDTSHLPAPGERLEFGTHRMNEPDAEAAPAWPGLGEVQRRADAKFKREQRKVQA